MLPDFLRLCYTPFTVGKYSPNKICPLYHYPNKKFFLSVIEKLASIHKNRSTLFSIILQFFYRNVNYLLIKLNVNKIHFNFIYVTITLKQFINIWTSLFPNSYNFFSHIKIPHLFCLDGGLFNSCSS